MAESRPRRSPLEVVVTKKCRTCGTKLTEGSTSCTFCNSPDVVALPEPEHIPSSEYNKR